MEENLDPISDIENEKAQHDIGVTAYRIYRGARSEGASWSAAWSITYAWFAAMFDQSMDPDDERSEG